MDPKTIAIACRCGKRLRFPKSRIGKPAHCPGCNDVLRVVTHGDAAAADRVRGVLTIASGPRNTGEQILLAGTSPISIGKVADVDLRLAGSQVSRSHASLVPTESGWRIEDNKSTNGLFVNEQRVSVHELHDGDRVRIGDFELSFADGTERARATSPSSASSPEDRAGQGAEVESDECGIGIRMTDLDGEPSATPNTTPVPVETETPQRNPLCPSCKKELAPSAKICVDCGIDLGTGRSLITSEDNNLNDVYVRAEATIGWVSWFVWTGIYPFASEALGRRRPFATRGIAIVTILTSFWFLAHEWTESPRMQSMKNMMLWSGDGDPPPEMLSELYTYTNYGDSNAFFEKYYDMQAVNPERSESELAVEAHKALRPDQQALGHYRTSQLITHAFLHTGIMHLVGNLLFLMVFGSRVNALLGNALTVVLYPILAIAAAIAHMASLAGGPPGAMLGASGAIMGLAGLYLVFFPLHKVHMAAWIRWGLFMGFRLSLKTWSVRGFWVVLFYIAFDVAYTAMGVQDGTAHWAHLGGFGMGAAIGVVLVCARLINSHGGDIISAVLGRRAWLLVGPPRQQLGALQFLP